MKKNERIPTLIKKISDGVYEKENIFKLSMLALLSGESIFLLGKPGVAKSLSARILKNILKKPTTFEYLMNRFSTPEEIFGPISITDLQKGVYRRLTKNYLPDANIVFLDEIWKAGPSIQNTLLTIINEKIFRNAGEDYSVPLKLLISASNELPESNQGLEALFDRFLIRYVVNGIAKEENFNAMIQNSNKMIVKIEEKLKISEKEYQTWLKEINDVKLSDNTLYFISKLRKALDELTEGKVYISDRRWKKICFLMKTSAYFNERMETDKPDLLIIPHCIWDNLDEQKQYSSLFYDLYSQFLIHELVEEQKNLESKIKHLTEKLNKTSEKNAKPSVYVDPFKKELLGKYHRFLTNNVDFPICFISVDDYQLLQKNFRHRVTLHFGRTLNFSTAKFLIDLKTYDYNRFVDNKKQIYTLELEHLDTILNQVKKINSEINDLEQEIFDLKQKFQLEHQKLLNLSNIFFDNQYDMILNRTFSHLNENKEEFIFSEAINNRNDFEELIIN